MKPANLSWDNKKCYRNTSYRCGIGDIWLTDAGNLKIFKVDIRLCREGETDCLSMKKTRLRSKSIMTLRYMKFYFVGVHFESVIYIWLI